MLWIKTCSTSVGDVSANQDNSVDHWVERGESAFSRNELSEAAECLSKALALNPFLGGIHNNLSIVLWRLGDKEQALNELTQALELDPDSREVILNCAKAMDEFGRGQDAKEILQPYLARKPWDEEVRAYLDSLDETGSESKPEQDPAEFLVRHGEYQYGKGSHDHAKACFEMAVEANPRHASALGNLGVIYWEQGNLEGAMEHLSKALEIDDQDPDIVLNSVKVLAAAGMINSAADLLQLYLRKHPDDEAAWRDYVTFLKSDGSSDWSPDSFGEQVAGIYLEMGERLLGAGDAVGAVEAINRSLVIRPGWAKPHRALARHHLDGGQLKEAVGILEEGLLASPNDRETVLMLARAHLVSEDPDKAAAICRNHLADQADDEIQELLAGLRGEVQAAV